MSAAAETIVPLLQRHFPELQAAWLFGTWGTDAAGTDSDCDLAILLPPARARAVSRREWFAATTGLAGVLGCAVDLINLRRVDTVFQNEIMDQGRLLAMPDDDAMAEFQMYSLSKWQKLNQERAGIVADILAGGRVLA